MFALVDCNNFFVSCERVFQPQYKGKPVVVLSNNDGCIVSRSQEAKALGIPMAGAYFKVRYIAQQHNVVAFSSNFSLYGDLSERVRDILESLAPKIEVYSVDEAFLEFPENSGDLRKLGATIVDQIYRWIGIPVSVGFAPTKTLAKVATDRAKKDSAAKGVCSLVEASQEEMDAILKKIPVTDVWGIGFRQGPSLVQQGIATAYDLKNAPEWLIRKQLTVHGARTVRELRGEVCFPLNFQKPKKSIASTRSFRRYITQKHELAEAIANYTARAARKLRGQNCYASVITVYIRTNHHSTRHAHYHNTASRRLAIPVASTSQLLKAALEVLDTIFKEGYFYQKAGVILSDIAPENPWQTTLWQEEEQKLEREKLLMYSVDELNKKWGDRTVFLARQGIAQEWKAREDFKSARYTTSWSELLPVKIG